MVIYDYWKPYFQLEAEHTLCNARHLRELKALEEIDKEPWATSMRRLLQIACGCKRLHPKGIPLVLQERIEMLYQQIVVRGLAFHESLALLPRTFYKGRPK